MDTVKRWWNPELAREQDAKRERQWKDLQERQREDRAGYLDRLKQIRDLEIENLKERHALQLHDHETRAREDLERHVRELETARRLLAEAEEREKERERQRARDGPEPPSRAR